MIFYCTVVISVIFLSFSHKVSAATATTEEKLPSALSYGNQGYYETNWLKSCPAPNPTTCEVQQSVSETFYGKMTISFGNVRAIKQELTKISLEVTALFHYYACYLNEFITAQSALTESLDLFEATFDQSSNYQRMCISNGNEIMRTDSCKAMATAGSQALSVGAFKSQAEALSQSYFRLHESVKMLLLYQAEISAKIDFLKTISANYSTEMSDFKASLTLVTSTTMSFNMHCTEKK
mmetsp:Transcript_28976/g.39800  ORF Transcript_28976/g.39800 Transcript_28976/m.39800 type:complete len:237 (+) Transcript_28976:82-792(+)|eukprot:CAMPEP_0170080552 /NCGR_PEP_ID=MMETSP0019_2-20121128/16666_1 /TAXON_ID=98059 /ORGANISM="Dinobryon sp., Strain UTEXLB2267" /LENGTH=236 /DNA_ID=CAMNT_0010294589 /DNA_START=17 /DNA_END=727 /DNA_ORIENTATION=+